MSQMPMRVARACGLDPAAVLAGLSLLVVGGLAWRNVTLATLACAGLAGFSLSGSP